MFSNKQTKIEKATQKGDERELIKLTNDKDMQIRLAAIAGLGKTRGDDGFNHLILLIRHPDALIRAAAAKSLGETRNPHAKTYLKAQYKLDTDPAAREAMAEAAAKIKEF